MEVKKILKNVATFLQLNDLLSVLNQTATATAEQTEDINLLVSCTNFVNNLIATDYIKLYKTKTLTVSSNYEITYEAIAGTDMLLGVVSVKGLYGDKVPFSVTENGIKVNYSGSVKVKYAYFPAEVSLSGYINDYKIKLNERIFAYGVAGEYLFIKGNIDDATMWDTRFKRELLTLTRPLSPIRLPVEKMI